MIGIKLYSLLERLLFSFMTSFLLASVTSFPPPPLHPYLPPSPGIYIYRVCLTPHSL